MADTVVNATTGMNILFGGQPPRRPLLEDDVTVPCLTLSFMLRDPKAYDGLRAEVVRRTAARLDAVRRGFVRHEKWLAVVALENRISACVKEKQDAEARAKNERAKARAAVIAGDRSKEADAVSAAFTADTEATDAERRRAILAEGLPTVRNGALDALITLLEAERAQIESAAASEAYRVAEELAATVSELSAALVAANVAAGATSRSPDATLAYHARHVSEYCVLPH